MRAVLTTPVELSTTFWPNRVLCTFLITESFHPFFGPILIVSYACLSNTLLLTGTSVFRLQLLALILIFSACIGQYEPAASICLI